MKARSYFHLLALMAAVCLSACDPREMLLRDRGDRVIARIEQYKERMGVLPDSLADVGIREEADYPLYYQKIADDRYQLWFGTSLGESMTYYSDSKRWESHQR